MSAKPTPEPWRVKPTDRHKVEGSPFEEGTVVASCWTSSFAPPPDEAAANAARIAAFVNACAGIPTEILATDGFSVVEALRHRDALLDACERVLNAAEIGPDVELDPDSDEPVYDDGTWFTVAICRFVQQAVALARRPS